MALSLGLRAIAAGYAGSGAIGYLAGGLDLAAGYATARRARTQTIDAVFTGGVITVVILSVFIVTQLSLPHTVFQGMANS